MEPIQECMEKSSGLMNKKQKESLGRLTKHDTHMVILTAHDFKKIHKPQWEIYLNKKHEADLAYSVRIARLMQTNTIKDLPTMRKGKYENALWYRNLIKEIEKVKI